MGAFPISIDYHGFGELARRPDVQARARSIRAELGDPETVLLGVDRLDYTKGIPNRLSAYEELLDSGQLGPPGSVLVQVASPSRERVEQYRVLREDVEGRVGRINGQHATLGQSAVYYLNHSYPVEEMAALYLAADVMLVTSLRDGMNLVAKEYVACCRRPRETARRRPRSCPLAVMRTARWWSWDLPDTTSSALPCSAVEAPSSGALGGAEAPSPPRKGHREVCRGDHEHSGCVRPDPVVS